MENSPVIRVGDSVHISVWVVPRSSRSELAGLHGDKLKLRVAAAPERGMANQETARLLETRLGVGARLVKGISSRHKVFEVARSDADNVRRELGLAE